MRSAALALAVLLPASILADHASQEVRTLELGAAVNRELAGQQSHSYWLQLRAGQFVHVKVAQRGIDVVVTLFAPNGDKLSEVDSPNGSTGDEPLSAVASATGRYRLQVAALEPKAEAGRYEVAFRELRAATPRDRPRIDATRLLNEAKALSLEGTGASSRQALAKYQEALGLFREASEPKDEALVLEGIAVAHTKLQRTDSALMFWGQLRELNLRIGDTAAIGAIHLQMGLSHSRLNRPDSAFYHYRRALQLERQFRNRDGEGSALHNIGIEYSRLGQPDSALAYFHLTLPIEYALADTAGLGITWNTISKVEGDMGRLDSALLHGQRALVFARAARQRGTEATALNNIGVVHHSLGRRDSALAYFRKSLVLRVETQDRYGEGSTRNNVGSVLDKLNQRDSALTYLRQALTIAREVRDRAGESSALQNIGLVFNATGRSDSAMTYYRLALPLARTARDRDAESTILHNIGKVHGDAGRLDSALAFKARALVLAREIGNRRSEAEILAGIGSVYAESGDWAATSAYFDSSTVIHAQVSARAGGEMSRLSYAEQHVALYGEWSRVWLARSEDLGRRSSVLGALAVSERGRAQALLELMRRSSVTASVGNDLASEGANVLKGVSQRQVAALSYVIANDTLIIFFARPNREPVALKRAVKWEVLAQLVDQFNRSIGRESGTINSIALRNGNQLDREATEDANAVRGAVGAVPASGVSAATIGQYLANLLLPPQVAGLGATVREIVIIPNGVLGLVPFAALPIDARGTPLGARFALRYSPSLAVLDETERRPSLLGDNVARAVVLRQSLVVGNPAMPTTSSRGEVYALASLPAADQEATAVARILGATPLRAANATETAVRRQLGTAPIVHLATHGYAFASMADVRNSFVALAADSMHDGFLDVGEILDDRTITMRAELVVLSACQTGLGRFRYAEGTVGLQRAFLAKGARSVLVSLWNVSDSATALLMQRFYEHWLRDRDRPSKSEALRRAQNDVRATRGFESPKYWAAFQLVGAA